MIYLEGSFTESVPSLDAQGGLVVTNTEHENCFVFLTSAEIVPAMPSILAVVFTGYSDVDKTTVLFTKEGIRMDVKEGETEDARSVRALAAFLIIAPFMSIVEPVADVNPL